MRLAINALRTKSGGAKSHIKGIINNIDPKIHGFEKVYIWTYKSISQELPKYDWLIIKTPKITNKNILNQLFWELIIFPRLLKCDGINILLNLDAGTFARYKCLVTMSRDMLSYEKGELQRYGLSLAALRLIILRYVQNLALKHSTGVIFLTNYASKIIQNSTGKIKNYINIPHGVSQIFKSKTCKIKKTFGNSINIIYVSNAAPYKHQWHVVSAIKKLINKGYSIKLYLVGGVEKISKYKLFKAIESFDKDRKFVFQYPFVNQEDLPLMIASSDMFVFASSCENMPNTLIEAMSIGIPIACSNRGPMPEVLGDAGIYFNPEKPEEIANSIERLIKSYNLRVSLSKKVKEKSSQYSWAKCAEDTFKYLSKVAKKKKLADI